MNIVIENLETGVIYTIFTAPTAIAEEAQNASCRGQNAGIIYGNGDRWAYTTENLSEQADVRLEFERAGQVVVAYNIPWQSWEAFKIVSARQGKSAKEYLTLLLGTGLAEGDNVGEMIHWLFSRPEPSPEIERFKAASDRFHGQEVLI